MKTKKLFTVLIALGMGMILCALVLGEANLAQAASQADVHSTDALLGTAFTYQGRLEEASGQVEGDCDFKFGLFGSASGTDQIGTTQTKNDVSLTNGYFSVPLDFGAGAFKGEARYLKVEVDCGGGFATLDPRVPLTPAPYALALPGLWTEQNATSPNVIGGYDGNNVTDGAHGATIGGGGQAGDTNEVDGNFGTIGGGYGHSIYGDSVTIGGGHQNIAGDDFATVGGGTENNASGLYSTIGGGWENDSGEAGATIGGGAYNAAALWSTIGGGWQNISYFTSTVGGGAMNQAIGYWSSIGGGNSNSVSGESATVGGGESNQASGLWSFIGGGIYNTSSGDFSTVGGGQINIASGTNATVPGGYGAAATLPGQLAYANGTFDWYSYKFGTAQASLYIMRKWTNSNGIWENLYLDDLTSVLLTISPARRLTFDILIAAGSDAGESAGYTCQGIIENISGTTQMIGIPTCTTLGEDVLAWDIRVQADNTNDALLVQVKGNGGTIRWVATVNTAEVSW